MDCLPWPDSHLTHFSFKFTAKSLQRQAKKANKDETAEKNKLKQVGRERFVLSLRGASLRKVRGLSWLTHFTL